MARADNTYSRIVAGMKILLPLVALGLLSTLFLISNTIDPSGPVPTAPIDLEQRAQSLGVTRPSFAGISGRGDEIKMRADVAWPCQWLAWSATTKDRQALPAKETGFWEPHALHEIMRSSCSCTPWLAVS